MTDDGAGARERGASDDSAPAGGAGTVGVPRRRRTWSVRLRLTVLTSALLCLTLLVGAVALTGVLSEGRIGAVDALLRQRTAELVGLVEEDRVPRTLPVAEPGEVAQVLDGDGRVVAASAGASRTLPLLDAEELARLEGEGVLTRATPYDDQARVAVRAARYAGERVHVVVSLPLGDVQGVLRALAVALGVVVPVLTLVLAGVLWTVLGRALRPVEQMRRAAAQVARTGGPGSLPAPATQDEIGALARTLNEMLDRLEQASARQRSFVADAAHELRSPVAALRAQVEVAAAHPEVWTAAELAAEVAPEVERMQLLVDDLLVLARVGSRPAADDVVDLAEVAGEALGADRARPASDAAGGVVRGTSSGRSGSGAVPVRVTGAGTAVGDPAGVARVLRNLVDNATRYGASRVEVTVAPGRVVVDDDGPGILPEDRDRVFARFVRLDPARDRDHGGTGLGLAIVRETVRAMGGDVQLAESPLGGLRAVVDLPRPPAG